ATRAPDGTATPQGNFGRGAEAGERPYCGTQSRNRCSVKSLLGEARGAGQGGRRNLTPKRRILRYCSRQSAVNAGGGTLPPLRAGRIQDGFDVGVATEVFNQFLG